MLIVNISMVIYLFWIWASSVAGNYRHNFLIYFHGKLVEPYALNYNRRNVYLKNYH